MEEKESAGYNTDKGLIIDGVIHKSLGGESRDVNDHARLRQGRDRHSGFKISNYIQSPPVLFTRDGHAVYLGDMYKGSSCFFIGGGPSFSLVDKQKLAEAGILTFGINNSPKSFRPNIWCSVDNPSHFIKSIWLDPKILKLVPICHAEKNIFDNENWVELETKVGDCPNVLFYRRNEKFDYKNFLFEDTINWGNHSKHGGGRSVMLASLRLMFFLGIRNVFLLGVDFTMDNNVKYHFDQDRTTSSINNNNDTYKKLIERFTLLKPEFDKHNFKIYNCNPKSELKVFPFIDINEALDFAKENLPKDLKNERTSGLYERQAQEKKKNNKLPKKDNDKQIINKSLKDKAKEALDLARNELNEAKKILLDHESNNVPAKEDEKFKEWEEKKIEYEMTVRNKKISFNNKKDIKYRLFYNSK